MRFRTRALLVTFLPFAALLAISFWMMSGLVQSSVKDGLRATLRAGQVVQARDRAENTSRNKRLLHVAGDNSALKAGMQLLLTDPGSEVARATVADQLAELGGHMESDLLLAWSRDGLLLSGVFRHNSRLEPVAGKIADESLNAFSDGLYLIDGRPILVSSVPVDQAGESLGFLCIGEEFDLAQFGSPTLLTRYGTVVRSTIPSIGNREMERVLSTCRWAECEFNLGGVTYLSLSMTGESLRNGFQLWSLQSEDAALNPIRSVLRDVFVSVSLIAAAVALLIGLVASRSMGRPIANVVSKLQQAANTGILPEFHSTPSGIREIQDLMDNFNRAAMSIREARDDLQFAYVECVGSLASALDARDAYTAGHSRRVSDLSTEIARHVGLPTEQIEKVRIGALLHDIGKIGIPDLVLQKPGRLNDDEFAIVKTHPGIGRRILAGVHGFAPYLGAVELHHENWDGTGYPHGQIGLETPVEARIIHLADAYDAMTTNRPYRAGMAHSQAIRIISLHAGTQFDPEIAAVLVAVTSARNTGTTVEVEVCTAVHA